MSNLDIWIKEAAKHGMKYCDYVAAVKDGLLPLPDIPPAKEPNAKTRKCRYCQKHFEPHHGSQRYCSEECRFKMELEKRRIKSDRWPKVKKRRESDGK